MPSVEIICVGQREPVDFWYMPFTVEAEANLLSHRGPTALFQPDFDQLQGCIYHLGGACLRYPPVRNTAAYTAADLCTEWWDFLHFKPRYVPWVNALLDRLLDLSPQGRLLFTNDYQFGPTVRRYKRPITRQALWTRHDAERLWTNSSFHITRDRPLNRGLRRK